MTKEQAEKIKRALQKDGLVFCNDISDEDYDAGVRGTCGLRAEYSGRGMFGQTTYAIEGPPSCASEHPKLFKGLRSDSMGKHNLIWY